MAHFAELDKNNKVLRVIVIDNNVTHDEDGVESEELGIAFCQSLFGVDTTWVQTSYNGAIRGKFAGEGDKYNAKDDVFEIDQIPIIASTPEQLEKSLNKYLADQKAATPTE